MNQFQIVGKVLEKPQKLDTSSGIKMAKLRVCVDKIKDDEKIYEVFEILLFKQLAELEFEESQLVEVIGRISANTYEKDGKQFFNSSLIANNVSVIA